VHPWDLDRLTDDELNGYLDELAAINRATRKATQRRR
jgi:hypothetical protein